jgi:aryl-alcohol dehydrogenase-like predicted oxidoreductase
MSAPPASAAGSFAIGGDLTVHRLGFGAMRIMGRTDTPSVAERQLAHAVLRRAVELGVTLIDTAPLYGVSEDLIGEAFPLYPDGVHVATKVGIVSAPEGPVYRGRPEQIHDDCERSLRRLHLDAIPLSQLHIVDPDVPIEESVGALGDLQREGKVRNVGLSNVDIDQLRRAQAIVRVASVQNRFSLDHRASADVLEACAAEGIAFLPWRPLAHDDLTAGGRRALAGAAARLDATPRQVALAWVLGHAPVVCAIPGTGDFAHLEENIAAAGLVLSPDERAVLDHAAAP